MMRRSPRHVQPLASTQESNGTAPSGPVSGPQLPHNLICSQVPTGPTRNVTGEVMPTSLAEAVTQLSFLEFLQRCGLLSRLSYQSPFHPWTLLCRPLHPVMPLMMCPLRRLISLSPRYLSTWQCRRLSTVSTPHLWMLLCRTLPHITVSQDVSTQMGARPASSFSLDAAIQTPIRSTVSHDTSTQLPLTEFSMGCIFSNDPFDRQGSSSAQGDIGSAPPPPLPDIATTCSVSSSSLDRNDHVRTLAPRVLLQPPPGLEQFAPPPRLAIDAHLCTSTWHTC